MRTTLVLCDDEDDDDNGDDNNDNDDHQDHRYHDQGDEGYNHDYDDNGHHANNTMMVMQFDRCELVDQYYHSVFKRHVLLWNGYTHWFASCSINLMTLRFCSSLEDLLGNTTNSTSCTKKSVSRCRHLVDNKDEDVNEAMKMLIMITADEYSERW